MKLKRYENNPILIPSKNYFENLCVLNPAVIYDETEDTFFMLYRAAGDDKEHYIYLGLAKSKDGYNFERMFDKPVISPDINGADGGCVEDPRLVKMGGYYYLTYASRTFPPGQYWRDDKLTFGFKPDEGPTYLINNNSITHLAISKDLINWKKLGRITDSRFDNRDVVIFPEKINGYYYRISRPMEFVGEEYGCKTPSIWISKSTDLMEWGNEELLYEGHDSWEDKKTGISTPPIRIKEGWLVLYHGVSLKDDCYRVGAFILDYENPKKILYKTKDFIMEPEEYYETSGYYNGCVFPTGICIKEDILYIYYGCADKYIGCATCKVVDLVKYMMEE